MQHCILVKWTPDAGDKDALAKEAASADAKSLRRIAIRRRKSDYEAASSAASAGGSFSISRMK